MGHENRGEDPLVCHIYIPREEKWRGGGGQDGNGTAGRLLEKAFLQAVTKRVAVPRPTVKGWPVKRPSAAQAPKRGRGRPMNRERFLDN